ncbi:MAG: hypothetical protein AW07_04408 [Candidatus Accumulibacter sp. SK-11]|nr:MAG: hypothetical protein AW07_04408 [Candidatus Accumulibacter sp. SK-11]
MSAYSASPPVIASTTEPSARKAMPTCSRQNDRAYQGLIATSTDGC